MLLFSTLAIPSTTEPSRIIDEGSGTGGGGPDVSKIAPLLAVAPMPPDADFRNATR
jgi:hypothetical protein